VEGNAIGERRRGPAFCVALAATKPRARRSVLCKIKKLAEDGQDSELRNRQPSVRLSGVVLDLG
jgi:hypothetical protein